jgi:hypothetical protein
MSIFLNPVPCNYVTHPTPPETFISTPYRAFTLGGGTTTSKLDPLLSARDDGCLCMLQDQHVKWKHPTYLFTSTLGRSINLDPAHVLAHHES